MSEDTADEYDHTAPVTNVSLDLSRDEIFWLASCHMLTVMIADGRPPSAVQEAYRIMKNNGTDLGTEGINNLYQRIALLVQANWPDSTDFVFPDGTADVSTLHDETTRGNPNVS